MQENALNTRNLCPGSKAAYKNNLYIWRGARPSDSRNED